MAGKVLSELRRFWENLPSEVQKQSNTASQQRIYTILLNNLLTPKFGKESDSWVRFDKESVWWKEGSFQRYSAKRSAVGYLLRFGKETVELILRDWMVTWFNQGGRMDG
jgi:hypothetical protein